MKKIHKWMLVLFVILSNSVFVTFSSLHCEHACGGVMSLEERETCVESLDGDFTVFYSEDLILIFPILVFVELIMFLLMQICIKRFFLKKTRKPFLMKNNIKQTLFNIGLSTFTLFWLLILNITIKFIVGYCDSIML